MKTMVIRIFKDGSKKGFTPMGKVDPVEIFKSSHKVVAVRVLMFDDNNEIEDGFEFYRHQFNIE